MDQIRNRNPQWKNKTLQQLNESQSFNLNVKRGQSKQYFKKISSSRGFSGVIFLSCLLACFLAFFLPIFHLKVKCCHVTNMFTGSKTVQKKKKRKKTTVHNLKFEVGIT